MKIHDNVNGEVEQQQQPQQRKLNSDTIPATSATGSNSSIVNPKLKSLEDENEQLKQKLISIRTRRRRINDLRQRCQKQQELFEAKKLNVQQQQRQDTAIAYVGTRIQLDHKTKFIDYASRWSTLNDCFFIWHNGPYGFATINGCRLGSDPLPMPPALSQSSHRANQIQQQQQQQQQQQHLRKQRQTNGGHTEDSNGTGNSPSSPSSSLSVSTTNMMSNGVSGIASKPSLQQQRQSPNPNSQPSQSQQQQQRVPWNEVNAALGHACLLLKILQETSNPSGHKNGSNNNNNNVSSKNVLFTHEIHPMGSTSKIGIRFYNPKTVTTRKAVQSISPVMYNLYYEESTGFTSLFRNDIKNFNLALQAFCQCVAEMASYQTDKTIAIPHEIRYVVSGSSSSSTLAVGSGSDGRTGYLNGHHKHHHSLVMNGNSSTNKNGGGTSYPFQNASTSPNTYCQLNGGEWTVGGLSICYPQTNTTDTSNSNNRGNKVAGDIDKIEWTRACKYLLIDLKWIVASAAKHVDR
jgi:Apg6 BARA domain